MLTSTNYSRSGLRLLFTRARRRRTDARRRTQSVPLTLEQLEDRVALAVDGWEGGGLASNYWSASGNLAEDPASVSANIFLLPSGVETSGANDVAGVTTWGATQLSANVSNFANATIIADINSFDAAPTNITPVGSGVFFTVKNASGEINLYKTDGSVDGAILVASFPRTVPNSLYSIEPSNFTAAGSNLFFTYNDGVHGIELWTSDGTPSGTRMVKDICPGADSSEPGWLTSVGGKLYFAVTDGTNPDGLWTSDGTEAGTRLVTVINSGFKPYSNSLIAAESSLYLVDGDDVLWKSDGTAVGTTTVTDSTGATVVDVEDLIAVGSHLVFSTSTSSSKGLWITNGTAAGTNVLKKFACSGLGGINSIINNITSAGSSFYFTVETADGWSGERYIDLWKSDGTPAGTVLVVNLDYEPNGVEHYMSFDKFVAVGSTVLLTKKTGDATAWFRSDGTAAGTIPFTPAAQISGSILPTAVLNGQLYFLGAEPGVGPELYKTNGTNGGTVLVKDILPGAAGSNAQGFVAANGVLYFTAHSTAGVSQLFRSDGTAAGTLPIHTISPGATTGSSTAFGFVLGNSLMFLAGDGINGYQWWKSDGTTTGTSLVIVLPGSVSSPAAGSTSIYFVSGADHNSVWRTDGTSSGTTDIKIASGLFVTSGLTVFGTHVVYVGTGGYGYNLYIDRYPLNYAYLSYPDSLTVAGPNLFFVATDSDHGRELWVSKGSGTNTHLVKDTRPGTASAFLGPPTPAHTMGAIGSTVYFAATDGLSGIELWKSDGTAAGTTLVADLNSGSGGSNPRILSAAGDRLFFTASPVSSNSVLYVTDGTAAGTIPLTPASYTLSTTALGSSLIFAQSSASGMQIRVSDGTVAGTQLLKTLPVGTSLPRFFVANGKAYFIASDAAHPQQVWVSDGTSDGTAMIADIGPGLVSYDKPSILGYLPNVGLVVAADDGQHGMEPMLIKVNKAPDFADRAFYLYDHAKKGTVVGTLQAVNAEFDQSLSYAIVTGNNGAFALDATSGVLTVADRTKLAGTDMILTVRASDDGIPSEHDDATVTIHLLQSDTAPVFSLVDASAVPVAIVKDKAILTIDEHTPTSSTQNGVLLGTISVTDAEEPGGSFSVTMTDSLKAFAFNAATGQITIADATQLNYEKHKSAVLTFEVADHGLAGRTSKAISKLKVTVNLNNLNETPTITSPGTFSIAENNKANSKVGTVKARDPDKTAMEKTLTYSIVSQQDEARNPVVIFAIDPTTGKISVPTAGALNYEAHPTFTVVVRATDGGTPALHCDQTITVSVLDLNEAPVLSLLDPSLTPMTGFTVAEHPPAGMLLGYVQVVNPDAARGETLTIAGSSSLKGAVTLSALDAINGRIAVMVADSTKFSLNLIPSGQFTLTVTATDSGFIDNAGVKRRKQSATAKFTINVM